MHSHIKRHPHIKKQKVRKKSVKKKLLKTIDGHFKGLYKMTC